MLLAALRRTTAHHVAARCGVTLSAVYGWRGGSRSPRSAARRLLERHFAIPIAAWEREARAVRR